MCQEHCHTVHKNYSSLVIAFFSYLNLRCFVQPWLAWHSAWYISCLRRTQLNTLFYQFENRWWSWKTNTRIPMTKLFLTQFVGFLFYITIMQEILLFECLFYYLYLLMWESALESDTCLKKWNWTAPCLAGHVAVMSLLTSDTTFSWLPGKLDFLVFGIAVL
jgi:hypothetical protein